MDDDDLQKIRQARLQELQGQQAGAAGAADQKREQEDEARKSILSQICTPEAVDRLGRIAMVKAERARDIERRLVMLAQTNQLKQRVTEEELISLIGMIDEKQKEEQKVVISRRKTSIDDDDDDIFDL